MCDPLIGGALSIASGLVSYSQQSSMMANQQASNDAWVAYQQQQSQKAWAEDTRLRQQAEAARQQTLTQLDPAQQKQNQQTEQTRLTTAITPQMLQAQNQPQLVGDMLLSGQKNAAPVVQQAIADRVTAAAQNARQRIAALAAIQSYGGSQGGMQTLANQALQTGGNTIGLMGNERQGNLAAYNVAKAVQPVQWQATPSPWGGIASGLAGIAGKQMGAGGFGNSGFIA